MHYIVMFFSCRIPSCAHRILCLSLILAPYISFSQPFWEAGNLPTKEHNTIWWSVLTAFPSRKSAVSVLIWFLVKLTFINLGGYSPPVYQQLLSRIFLHYILSLILSRITWMRQLGIPNVDHEKQNEMN